VHLPDVSDIIPLIGDKPMGTPPDKLTLKGTIRDFKSYVTQDNQPNPGGHIDFENVNESEKGIVAVDLASDKKPVYLGGNNPPGHKTTHGQDAFDQWYGRNLKYETPYPAEVIPCAITLTLDPATKTYTFDSTVTQLGAVQDEHGGFFPIDNQGFGNEGRIHNYSFTFELHTQFTFQGYESFTYTGDDDLWVFIDNQLVIDLGGVHYAQKATVNLQDKTITYYSDRTDDYKTVVQSLPLSLNLTVGKTYDLDFFFAERHTFGSFFRIDTSLALVTVPLARITASQPNASKITQAQGELTITLDPAPTESVTVLYTITADSTAAENVDVYPLGRSVTFNPGEHSKTVPVVPGPTWRRDTSQMIIVALQDPPTDPTAIAFPYKADPALAIVTIVDQAPIIEDPRPQVSPVVTLVASKPSATKPMRGHNATDLGQFTIQLDQPAPHDMFINFSVGGNAREGVDCQAMDRRVFFYSGQTSATMPVIPLANPGPIPCEVQCTLQPGEGYQAGSPVTGTVNILVPGGPVRGPG
jgi:fibro-slime domain-containing protein